MMKTSPASSPQAGDYRWVPWAFVAFFAVIFAVLGGMVWLSLDGYTGLVTEQAYNKGLAYNKTIAAAQKQEALGWTGEITASPSPEGAAVSFLLRDSSGKPLDGAAAKLWMIRPTQAGFDVVSDLKPLGGGKYAAQVALPLRGLWDAKVSAVVGAESYQIARRLVVAQ